MSDKIMKPYGPLMVEHRLIEKVIELIKDECQNITQGNNPNTGLVKFVIDFFHTYADECHHGKEEDILFKELQQKNLSKEHKTILDRLLEDHKAARKNIKQLRQSLDAFHAGQKDAIDKISEKLLFIIELYPEHIKTEDREFFIPCIQYFSKEEQDKMLKKFWVFDRQVIHEKYKQEVNFFSEKKIVNNTKKSSGN